MDSQLIQVILGTNLPGDQKLQLIDVCTRLDAQREYMDPQLVQAILEINLPADKKIELIDKLATLLTKFNEFWERTPHKAWHTAAEEFASSLGLKGSPPDPSRVKSAIQVGINWLMQNQHKDGGWGWVEEKRLSPIAWKKLGEKGESNGNFSLPWDTAVATLAIHDWGIHFKEQNTQALVKTGCEWLIKNQNLDGGWGGRLGVDPESSSNAIETGAALWLLCFTNPHVFEDSATTRRGLEFLARLQCENGGYSLQSGLEPDAKSTAIATAIGHCYGQNPKCISRGISWLLEKQEPAGNWIWPRVPYSQIDATFYAIEALRIYHLRLEASEVLDPMRKAVAWYKDEAHLVIQDQKVGWAWDNAENTAAAIIARLDSGEPNSSPSIERGIEWLIARYDSPVFWGFETPLVLLALIRYLEPKARLEYAIRKQLAGVGT